MERLTLAKVKAGGEYLGDVCFYVLILVFLFMISSSLSTIGQQIIWISVVQQKVAGEELQLLQAMEKELKQKQAQ